MSSQLDPTLVAQLGKCFEKKSALMKEYDSQANGLSKVDHREYKVKMEAAQYQITEINNDIKVLSEILKGNQLNNLSSLLCKDFCHKS